jgi:hypothetical protein
LGATGFASAFPRTGTGVTPVFLAVRASVIRADGRANHSLHQHWVADSQNRANATLAVSEADVAGAQSYTQSFSVIAAGNIQNRKLSRLQLRQRRTSSSHRMKIVSTSRAIGAK